MSSKYFNQPATATVTDVDGLRAIYIFARASGGALEVVYASDSAGEDVALGDWGTRFLAGERTSVTDGYSYTFLRSGGWVGDSLEIITHALDVGGNLTVASTTYDVGRPTVEVPDEEDEPYADRPIDFLLDGDGDVDTSAGDMHFSTGLAGVRQACVTALRLVFGEWFLDEAAGVDYFGKLLVKDPNFLVVNQLIREAILTVPFIEEVTSVGVAFDSATRHASITWSARASFGTVAATTTALQG